MRTLRITYTEAGADYPLEIHLEDYMLSPLRDGVLTLQGVVEVVDSAVTGIVRQPADERAVGVYPRWETYPPGSAHKLLVLEHVNGDGTVSTLNCTRGDAEKIRAFLSAEWEAR